MKKSNCFLLLLITIVNIDIYSAAKIVIDDAIDSRVNHTLQEVINIEPEVNFLPQTTEDGPRPIDLELRRAIESDKILAAHKAINDGANVNFIDEDGHAVEFYAKSASMYNFLLEKKNSEFNFRPIDRELFWYIEADDINGVGNALENGANIYLMDETNKTVDNYVSSKEIRDLLCQERAKHKAITKRSEIKIILENIFPEGIDSIVERYLPTSDIDYKESLGSSLILAINNKDITKVNEYLLSGANPNQIDAVTGCNAFSLAKKLETQEIIKLFIKFGAKENKKKETTAVMDIKQGGMKDLLKPANIINITDYKLLCLLFNSELNKINKNLIVKIIASNPDILFTPDNLGNTPVSIAIRNRPMLELIFDIAFDNRRNIGSYLNGNSCGEIITKFFNANKKRRLQ